MDRRPRAASTAVGQLRLRHTDIQFRRAPPGRARERASGRRGFWTTNRQTDGRTDTGAAWTGPDPDYVGRRVRQLMPAIVRRSLIDGGANADAPPPRLRPLCSIATARRRRRRRRRAARTSGAPSVHGPLYLIQAALIRPSTFPPCHHTHSLLLLSLLSAHAARRVLPGRTIFFIAFVRPFPL